MGIKSLSDRSNKHACIENANSQPLISEQMKLQLAQSAPLVFIRQSPAQTSLSRVPQGTNALVTPRQRHAKPALAVMAPYVSLAEQGHTLSLPRRRVFPVPKVTNVLLQKIFPLSALEQPTNLILVKRSVRSAQPAFAVTSPRRRHVPVGVTLPSAPMFAKW